MRKWQEGPRAFPGGHQAKFGTWMIRFTGWLGQAVISVIQSNAYLSVAVKVLMDMVHLCSRTSGNGAHHPP